MATGVSRRHRFRAVRGIEAQNHALRGIPEDRVRYHICSGNWHGPHTHDLPLKHVVDRGRGDGDQGALGGDRQSVERPEESGLVLCSGPN
jgi:hypothetical protein